MLSNTLGFRAKQPTAIKHFVKTDNTTRTTTSTTAEEATNYTITWEDLVAAGFVATDTVFILVAVKQRCSDANQNPQFAVGFGTTFAGRAEDSTSVERSEPINTANGGSQYMWIDHRDLVTDEDIYFRFQTSGVTTASFDEFRCLILKTDDLTANDFVYAENAPAANAPDAYDTNGASVTVPLTGDWLFIATTTWLVDAIDDDYMFMAIHDGTADISEVKTDGEDTGDSRVFGTMAYKAGLASTTVVQVRYHSSVATTHDISASKIFGLRLGAFVAHAGQQSANTITHSVLDTYQEFAGFGTYNHVQTGPLLVLGWPIHTITASGQAPYGRIQIAGADWPSASFNRIGSRDNGTAAQIAPFLFGYAAAETNGVKDIDLDTAEDLTIAVNHDSNVQVAIAVSLMLS